MRKLAVGTFIVVALLMLAWILAGYLPVRGIETPRYEVISVQKGYEIRQYAAHIVAEVQVSGGYKQSINTGFRKVADYIFGNNTVSEKIAMTAPVLHEKQAASEKIAMTAPVLHGKSEEAGRYTVAFVMPSTYTLETLPKPNNPDIVLRLVPPKQYAVLCFGGYATQSRTEKKTEAFLALLKADAIETNGLPSVAQYQPPWTPPFMRRNEVLIEIQ